MRDAIADVGARGLGAVHGLGRFGTFAGQVAASLATPPPRVRRALDELYDVGVRSLPVIGVCGLAVGMVLGLQGY
ncbi:MAG TPA: ABC transporter permease, partial [Myxococcota bacterium]|nr:ABC transporter permease [Myxococcota bacterium]